MTPLDVYTAETVRNCLSYMSDEKIAAHVKCDVEQVRRARGRLTRKMPEDIAAKVRLQPTKNWKPEEIAIVLEMWASGVKSQVIGDKLGATRSMIEGVARRNGGKRP